MNVSAAGRGILALGLGVAGSLVGVACHRGQAPEPPRAAGYVEATEVRVAPQVGGRVVQVAVAEGDRVEAGALIARLDTADAELARTRTEAERVA